MRIVAGAWRGRALAAPPGQRTRPTADRVRQALFDRLAHAPWAGRATLDGARVLDAFAGTGAMGLEALSRGAASAVFIERDRVALAALRANILACRAETRAQVLPNDVLRPPPGRLCRLAFLDPPYGQSLLPAAVEALCAAGWIGPGSLLLCESSREDPALGMGEVLADFTSGAARVQAVRL